MAAPPEDDRKTAENLPDPELNPMTNTLLAQNMGRWAEVYFTTPPEKRDEAVQELLRELGSGIKPTQNGAEKITVSEQEILDAKQKFVELEKENTELQRKPVQTLASAGGDPADTDLVCPACLSKNKPRQHFCGLCGFTLTSSPTTPVRPQPPVAPHLTAPPTVERDGNDWGWLNERNRNALAERHHSGAWKSAVLVIVILIACGATYLWWRGSMQISSADERPRSDAENGRKENGVREPSAIENSHDQPRVTPQNGGPSANAQPSATDKADASAGATLALKSATSSGRAEPTSERSAPEGGREELQTARQYLQGRGVPKDSTLAAQWLWRSVAKENSEAVLILADMYAAGDGVPKSCDQARLLLVSAMKKGSRQGRDKLQDILANCR